MVPSTGDSWLFRDPQRRLSLTSQRRQSVRLPLQLLSPPTPGAPRLLSARCRSLPAAGAFLELWAAFQWQRGCCGVASRVLQGAVDSAYLTSLSVPAILWGLGVLWLLLLPCEQFISFTDSSLLTSHSREDEVSCLIRLKLVLSLDFSINKLLSWCHYLISVF